MIINITSKIWRQVNTERHKFNTIMRTMLKVLMLILLLTNSYMISIINMVSLSLGMFYLNNKFRPRLMTCGITPLNTIRLWANKLREMILKLGGKFEDFKKHMASLVTIYWRNLKSGIIVEILLFINASREPMMRI